MVVQVVNFSGLVFWSAKWHRLAWKTSFQKTRLLPAMRDSGRKQLSGSRRLMNVKITELTKWDIMIKGTFLLSSSSLICSHMPHITAWVPTLRLAAEWHAPPKRSRVPFTSHCPPALFSCPFPHLRSHCWYLLVPDPICLSWLFLPNPLYGPRHSASAYQVLMRGI